MYYFAYGSCMDTDSFMKTVDQSHFNVLGRAVLRNYKLAFTLYSNNRKGGVADVVSSHGDYVEGVLYHLSAQGLPPLDEREGVSREMYKREEISVEYDGKSVDAMTYMVVNKNPVEFPPSIDYAQLIYNGAVKFLSFGYRKKMVQYWNKQFGITFFNDLERAKKD